MRKKMYNHEVQRVGNFLRPYGRTSFLQFVAVTIAQFKAVMASSTHRSVKLY